MRKPTIPVVILGPANTGKSVLFRGLIPQPSDNQMTNTHIATIGVDVRFLRPSDAISVRITDTAGDERFASVRKAYIAESRFFLIVLNAENEDINSNFSSVLQEIETTKKAAQEKREQGNNKTVVADEYKIAVVINHQRATNGNLGNFKATDEQLARIHHLLVGHITPDPTNPLVMSLRQLIARRVAGVVDYKDPYSPPSVTHAALPTSNAAESETVFTRNWNWLTSFFSSQTTTARQEDGELTTGLLEAAATERSILKNP